MNRKLSKVLVIALSLGALVGSSVYAYVLLSPARTWSSPPSYIVDNRGIPDISDGSNGVTYTINALLSSSSWNGAGSGTLFSASSGSVSGFSLGDGVPMLNFRDPIGSCTGSCLAATFTGYYSSGGGGTYNIDDADIVTNYSGHSWTSQGEDPGGSGCSGEIYVEGVMVHEMGHALGLAHSSTSGATMYPSVSSCNNGPATIATDDANGINALYGGGGGGGAPCTGCTQYNGSLSGTGSQQFQPNGTYYYSSSSGTHQGWLQGPAGTDFDLYLWKWNGSSWSTVASSLSSSSTEQISYSGTSGYYAWRIYSYSGSGSYSFWLKKP